MPSALLIINLALTRGGRLGKVTLANRIAEATNESEYRMNAAFVPNQPVTKPPNAAPSVSIADHVTEAMALAASNSRSDTIEGIAAVFAGSKKAENANCKTVSTYTSHI